MEPEDEGVSTYRTQSFSFVVEVLRAFPPVPPCIYWPPPVTVVSPWRWLLLFVQRMSCQIGSRLISYKFQLVDIYLVLGSGFSLLVMCQLVGGWR